MGEIDFKNETQPEQLRMFMKALLNDLRALEHLVANDMIEKGVRRIGAEQELFLVDQAWRPAAASPRVLERLDPERFKTELAQFNLEFNLQPIPFGGDCLRVLEKDFDEHLQEVRTAAQSCDVRALLVGILPTLRMSDLDLANMTPVPRYHALNEALKALRGEDFVFRINGVDELISKHDSVMVEACNTSTQFHFQTGTDEFANLYNIAQVVAGPVLAAAVNSPLLFGRRLWAETRIAVFQQAVDTRKPGDNPLAQASRVSFGTQWVEQSAVEIFREDIARFRVVMGMDVDEDPFEVIEAGGVPKLKALQLHNSTVYRWNRPCYGISEGKPHLRIENRAIPTGPTVLDEVANAAFWFGLMSALTANHPDIRDVTEFDDAKRNFFAAARLGLEAPLIWLHGEKMPAPVLILRELLPMASEGLLRAGVDHDDVERYLGVIRGRVGSGQTGTQWLVDSLGEMKDEGSENERLCALTAGIHKRQLEGKPVHEWTLAKLDEAGGWKNSYQRVEQYMATDLFTVHADEVIDLAANLMDWRRVRHIPVEDDQHHLVGLISYRSLLRFLAHDLPHGKDAPVPVSEVMQKNPIFISPETPTLEAIRIMRRDRVSCLPVVKNGTLVGMVTDRDFMEIAAELLESHLRE